MSNLLPDDINLFLRWLFVAGMLVARYIIFAGGAYLLFYVYKKREWFAMKIQQKFPERKQQLTEIKYSSMSFFVFATVGTAIRYLVINDYLESSVYRNFSQHSVLYFVLSTVFVIFFHDTYFYWAHRLMHHPFFYERVHKVHHLSKDPTPFAAFAFHPLEALVEIGFIPILVFSIPLHFSSLVILSMWMIIFNVMGHLGYETFPRYFTRNFLFKWVNTATNHNMHHKYVTANYGLYFNIWDKIMNTNHSKYLETFDKVVERREAGLKNPQSAEASTEGKLEAEAA
jgi:lathosterol oxidase